MSLLPDGWRALERDEILRVWQTEEPITAMWSGPGDLNVTLYDDGAVEVDGSFPVELLPHISLAWHASLRGKVA